MSGQSWAVKIEVFNWVYKVLCGLCICVCKISPMVILTLN